MVRWGETLSSHRGPGPQKTQGKLPESHPPTEGSAQGICTVPIE